MNVVRNISPLIVDNLYHSFVRNGNFIKSGKNIIKPKIIEVGPRDGIQNIKKFIPTNKKIKLIEKLLDTGIKDIEIASFVSKKAVPQMADAEIVTKYFTDRYEKYSDIRFIALTPNMKGYISAVNCGIKNVAIFTAASETFCKKNIGCSIEKSIERYKEICKMAKQDHIQIRGYVSCIAGCPYEKDVCLNKTIEVVNELYKMGCYEISLGDTIGVGKPEQISHILDHILTVVPVENIAVHFHDTYGNAIHNIKIAIEKGIVNIDSSVGGLGGCPFAPGAPGNVSTEDVIHLLQKMNLSIHMNGNKMKDITSTFLPKYVL